MDNNQAKITENKESNDGLQETENMSLETSEAGCRDIDESDRSAVNDILIDHEETRSTSFDNQNNGKHQKTNIGTLACNEKVSCNQGIPVCLLHVTQDGRDTGKITLFSEDTLKKCNDILKARKEQNLKYSNLVLPDTVDSISGFHIDCYRRFTALSKIQREKIEINQKIGACEKNEKASVLTRSKIALPKNNERTGVFQETCLFCGQKRKKNKGVDQKLVCVETTNFEENIRKYAQWKNDQEMIVKISDGDFIAKEVKYHQYCRVKYQTEAESTKEAKEEKAAKSGKNNSNSAWCNERKVYTAAFEVLCHTIENDILHGKDVYLMTQLNKLYESIIHEIGGEDYFDKVSTTQKLEEKIKKKFSEKIKIEKGKKRHGNIIFKSQLSTEEALRKQGAFSFTQKTLLRDAALKLREDIMSAKCQTLPQDLTLKDIYKGEVEVPEAVTTFLKYLIGGPDVRVWEKEGKSRRIKSISEDIVFAATSGRKKPSKHLKVGIALKSLTGSKKTIEMMNKLGHCVSYNLVEELETELTLASRKETDMVPFGMKKLSSYATGLAWDNFDRFVETASGKNTLHDTVGIAYQTVSSDDEYNQSNTQSHESEQTHFQVESDGTNNLVLPTQENPVKRSKRSRSIEPIGLHIEPYRKKPKIAKTEIIPYYDSKRTEEALALLTTGWKQDFLWIADLSTSSENVVPMWVGWNAYSTKSDAKLQKIWYMRQINQSPTSNDVVAETMKRSILVADESGKTSIAVTYDLAIAKIAMRIQEEEKPTYDRVFIALGSFHVELAFFSALGKIIAESGGPHILNECNILANGSLNGFLKGKNYNRCKKVHEMFAAALQLLHFQKFLSRADSQEDLKENLSKEVNMIKEKKSLCNHTFTTEVDAIFDAYYKFLQDTLDGNHGKTAQFWMQYISYMQLYHEYSRSVRNGDLDSYVQCLSRFANIFFAMNHPNYARWSVLYHSKLLMLHESHPEVYDEFKRGLFSIKRTVKPFSSSPIDLSLEQTINADAASQTKGIISATNSISARQRWCESHYLRTTIMSTLFEELNISKSEDVTASLKPHNILKDNIMLNDIINTIKENMNPFDNDVEDDYLFNISTGKAASVKTADFLLDVYSIGAELKKNFIQSCSNDMSRFEKRIPKTKVSTFATDVSKLNVKKQDGKVINATLVRDLFGSLLCLAIERKIDIAEVFKYPLSTVPLSLSHVDGSMLKTSKSTLMNHLESLIVSRSPDKIDVTIIDASFFLHLQHNLPSTYGDIAKYLLRAIMKSHGDQVHFVTDKWIKPSIKDSERQIRNASSQKYTISGPLQKRPSNWAKALTNSTFKESFIAFLVEYWKSDDVAHLFQGKKLFANCGNNSFSYYCDENGKTISTLEDSLCCVHEEADTRMFFHLQEAPQQSNVVIRTYDTDCLIIALSSAKEWYINLNVWLEVGVQSKNTLKFICVNDLYSHLGMSTCLALPGFHAFTGCDYESAFNRKGKINPFKILKKKIEYQIAFQEIGEPECYGKHTEDVIEKFVCEMYGNKLLSSVNQLRVEMFFKKYKTKGNQLTGNAKKMDSSTLPPCQKVLYQKIQRSRYIANRWRRCLEVKDSQSSPLEFGWISNGDSFKPLWFEGELLPSVLDVVCSETDDETTQNPDSYGENETEMEESSHSSDDESDDDSGDDDD